MIFQLRCETCAVTFEPIVATQPGELSAPDEETVKEQLSERGYEMLREFHSEHRGHALEELRIDQ